MSSIYDYLHHSDSIDQSQVERMIETGSYVNEPCRVELFNRGRIIHYVAKRNLPIVLRTLICYGADVDVVDSKGLSPLHHAVSYNMIENVEILLDYGAIVDHEGVIKSTPLMWACQDGKVIIAKLLLDRGANPNACTGALLSATVSLGFLSSFDGDNLECVKLLLSYGADIGQHIEGQSVIFYVTDTKVKKFLTVKRLKVWDQFFTVV
jgi:ankyrin repeat protein